MGVLVIPEGKSVLFRTAIFIGLGTVVTTIIYLTPIPDQYPQSCSRPCHELDWPMICRVKLTFERYQTLGGACKGCPYNQTDCYQGNCITVDGEVRGILTANRQFPGPTLQVCQHDIMVIDIVNRVPGQSFGVHWRGQSQSETPYMDGVPMITQCPISSLTTFQYKFRASEAGTHMWQVNTGEDILETLFGPLIVRTPDSKEVHRKLYDTDDLSNVVVIHPWNPNKSNFLFEDNTSKIKLLINGKTQEGKVPPAVFKITQKKRHRFRVIYMGGTNTCQIRLSISKHKFLVIALDGHSITPKMVTSAKLFPGERLDFVLKGDQVPGQYLLTVDPVESCHTLIGTNAVIIYKEADKSTSTSTYLDESSIVTPTHTELQTINDETCDSNNKKHQTVCLHEINSAVTVVEDFVKQEPDYKLYLFYKSSSVSKHYAINTTFIAMGDSVTIPQTNNFTMMLPSSPLLSQSQHVNPDNICNNDTIPERCKNNPENVCECIHMVDIPLNSVVELILVNQDLKDHIFHMHGYNFRILGASKLSLPHLRPEKIKYLDKNNELVRRNINYPIIKDTVAVISNSVVVLRFKANNPGYWLFDEEHTSHWSRGMSLILHVGQKSDLSPIPKNFPKCGDWIGPEFFLV